MLFHPDLPDRQRYRWALLFIGVAAIATWATSALAHAGGPLESRSWKDDAVVYGIAPSYLSKGYPVSPIEAVRQRLPEIKDLGANVLWLLPVFQSGTDGQGYDIVDYDTINPSFGTSGDMKKLVSDAHAQGIHVILDISLNHTSAQHPFAQDVIQKGPASPYYNYYQHDPIAGIPYAEYFHPIKIGQADFVYYFWSALLNLNYDNPMVREFTLGVLENWVREYDVDGFRFDTGWGPQSRWPGFYPAVSERLRAIKADVFLLAEDKAAFPAAYAGSGNPHLSGAGFDAAYDWNSTDPNWMSKWAFQVGDHVENTVFNESDPVQAACDFIQGLANSANPADVRPLRYLENNDTASFAHTHTLDQTRFAAEVEMFLPGIPLIFYGQEVGSDHAQWWLPDFDPTRTIRSYNPELWDFYQQMIATRRGSPALVDGTFELANPGVENPATVTFTRQAGHDTRTVSLDFAHRKVSITP